MGTKIEKSLDIDTEKGTLVEGEVETKQAANDIRAIIKALSGAVEDGQITTRQARDMRKNLGIHQSFFTRKHTTKAKRKTKRKIQKAARRASRA